MCRTYLQPQAGFQQGTRRLCFCVPEVVSSSLPRVPALAGWLAGEHGRAGRQAQHNEVDTGSPSPSPLVLVLALALALALALVHVLVPRDSGQWNCSLQLWGPLVGQWGAMSSS